MRAFVAVEVPDAVKAGAAEIQRRLRGAGVEASWSRPEGLHLTLKFLGEIDEAAAPGITQALSLALGAAERFRLRVEGVGTFPAPASARVVWLGLGGEVGRLVALQAAVEQALAGAGLEPEARPYSPHLTIGRIKRIRRRDAWLQGLESVRDCALPGFAVTAVSLIRSELKPGGAVYRELGSVPLKEGPDAV